MDDQNVAHETPQVRLGFIGFGNMAQALAKGLVNAGAIDPAHACACARDWDKLCRTTGALGITPLHSAADVVDVADVVVVAVKPYQVADVLAPVREALATPGKVVLSVAAGMPFETYEQILAPGTHHVSCVPNTPVSVGQGVFVVEDVDSLDASERTLLDRLLGSVGIVVRVDTAHMGVAGTIAGCGPAWICMAIEALGDAGVKHGLTRAQAYQLAGQMVAGTGAMLVASGEHPGALKDAVCSPGGTTIKGVAALERAGLRSAMIDAVDAVEGW
ncbi:MAG: pyrroline-5-carboxylate reductase [Coriobacteriia bacterium]|nr:pyrroline-5-carboxylate reductase [Coriobacteriia bacterium]MBS5477139.1 pyrroline-5-carboxylate reductase [Coriobacteriia bacterium]